MTYEEAREALGVLPVSLSEPMKLWLVGQVEDIISRLGVDGLRGWEGRNLINVFNGNFPPEPRREGE